jgi:hypothetical protein
MFALGDNDILRFFIAATFEFEFLGQRRAEE